MKIEIKLSGPVACGKTHMANRIAELIEAEALGTEYEIVSSLGEGSRSRLERRGHGRTAPAGDNWSLPVLGGPRRLRDI